MRRIFRGMGLSVSLAALAACSGGVTGPVGTACIEGGRSAANPVLCSCVQAVADQTLTGAEQRRAARFFDDPDRAQETRTSDRPADEEFWARYRAFADTARASCG